MLVVRAELRQLFRITLSYNIVRYRFNNSVKPLASSAGLDLEGACGLFYLGTPVWGLKVIALRAPGSYLC
jgi:hypothetical protein